MTTSEVRTTDFSVVTTMLDSIERGDLEGLRRCYAPGALTWHNNDEIAKEVDAVVGLLGQLLALSSSRTYEDRRVTTVGSVAFLQHTLIAELRSGGQFRLPAIMRVEVDDNGLVARIEEYADWRPIMEVLG